MLCIVVFFSAQALWRYLSEWDTSHIVRTFYLSMVFLLVFMYFISKKVHSVGAAIVAFGSELDLSTQWVLPPVFLIVALQHVTPQGSLSSFLSVMDQCFLLKTGKESAAHGPCENSWSQLEGKPSQTSSVLMWPFLVAFMWFHLGFKFAFYCYLPPAISQKISPGPYA